MRYRIEVLDENNAPVATSPAHVTTIDDVIVLCLSGLPLTPEDMVRLYDTVSDTFNRRVLILPAGVAFVRLIRDD